MDLAVEVEGDDSGELLLSLQQWLSSNREAHTRIIASGPRHDLMGSRVESRLLLEALATNSSLSVLASAITSWLATRPSSVTVRISTTTDSMTIEGGRSSGSQLAGALSRLIAAGSSFAPPTFPALWGPDTTTAEAKAGTPDDSEPSSEKYVQPSLRGDNLNAAQAIYMYLDTEDSSVARRVFMEFDNLLQVMGYSVPIDEEISHGSILRRAKTFLARTASSDEMALRLGKIERAIEIAQLDKRQAEVDGKEAEAVSRLLESLAEVPQACMRVGSLLIVKFQEPSGPVVLARTLTQIEMRALNRFPEIQARPRDVMKALDTAVTTDLDAASVEQASNSAP